MLEKVKLHALLLLDTDTVSTSLKFWYIIFKSLRIIIHLFLIPFFIIINP